MVVVVIVGTKGSGKKTIASILEREWQFKLVDFSCIVSSLLRNGCDRNGAAEHLQLSGLENDPTSWHDKTFDHKQELLRTIPCVLRAETLKRKVLLPQWQQNIAVTGICCVEALNALRKCPLCIVIWVDAPVLCRFRRWKNERDQSMLTGLPAPECVVPESLQPADVLEFSEFLSLDDEEQFQKQRHVLDGVQNGHNALCKGSLAKCRFSADSAIANGGSVQNLVDAIARLELLDDNWIRPSWDLYFSQLALLSARRANCMKRRVGAVVVKNNRVIATGYNGTPFGQVNCRDGGCGRCNDPKISQGQHLEACLCLHAEQNAFLEAGTNECAGATLYVTLMPCLSCAKMAVQVGVKRIVYLEAYGSDNVTVANLFSSAGVKVHYFEFQPPSIRCVWM